MWRVCVSFFRLFCNLSPDIIVCPSVCPSVRFFPRYHLNQLTFELEFVRVKLKLKVINHSQRSMSNKRGRGNAVTRSV